MRVGYVRCSTIEQNEARQLKMMEDKVFDKNQVTIAGEIVSGFTYSHEVFGEGFYLVDVKAFWLMGILTGLLDVLPFVGTGITLLPFMFWKYLNGEMAKGTILLITFLVSATARELLEPKLIGKKMNVLPVLILVSVYAGVQVFGILGVFLGPFYVMLLQECFNQVYVKGDDVE